VQEAVERAYGVEVFNAQAGKSTATDPRFKRFWEVMGRAALAATLVTNLVGLPSRIHETATLLSVRPPSIASPSPASAALESGIAPPHGVEPDPGNPAVG
jgi:hypothetical protein